MKERDQISKKVEDSAANGRGFIGVARLEHGGVMGGGRIDSHPRTLKLEGISGPE